VTGSGPAAEDIPVTQQGVSGERFCSVFLYELDFQMNTKMSKLVVAMGALVMAGGAMAQSTATGTGTANATVRAR